MTSRRERRRERVVRVAGMLAIGALLGGAMWWCRGRSRPGAGAARSMAAIADARASSVLPPGVPALPSQALGGLVVDGRGQPVPNVRIELRAPPVGPAAGLPLASADTGVDGRFVITGLVDGLYGAILTGPGVFSLELADLRVPSDDLRLVVARQVEIAGRVLDGARPLVGAQVAVRADELGATLQVETDAQGGFALPELPEGSYQVWAWQNDLATRAIAVPRLGAGPFAPLELVVEPAAVVVGRVVERGTSTGLPCAIELRPAVGEREPARHARTDADGAFRIEGVPHGRWILDGHSPGYVAVGAVEFEAGRGVLALELARGGVIEGMVIDERGTPVAGAEVSAHGMTASGELSTVRGELSESIAGDQLRRYAGYAIATPVVAAGLGGSAGTAWASDPLFEPRGELGVVRGPIPMPPIGGPMVASVSVAGGLGPTSSSGMAAHGPRVVACGGPDVGGPAPLAAGGDPPIAPPIWRTGTDGRFRIIGVARGLTTVVGTAPGMAPGRSFPVRVDLGRTSTEVEVTMPTGAMIVGTVRDTGGIVVAGALVTIRPEFPGKPAATTTGADGGFRIGPAAGETAVRASALGFGDAEQVVVVGATLDALGDPLPGGATPSAELLVDLVLTVADARLIGEVVDEGGLPVRGARLVVVDGPAAGRSALVGDAGYTLERLPAGPLRVRVEHPDYPPVTATLTATASGALSPRLELRPGGAIAGFVLDRHTGAGLTSLAIRLTGPGQAVLDLVSGVGGAFAHRAMPPGRWRLAVDSPGYVPASLELDVPAGTRPGLVTRDDVRLQLERGALLGGVVRDHYGTRIAGATIRVRGAEPPMTSVTDADGAFRLVDVPTGRLTISVTHGDKRGEVTEEVRPGDERLAIVIDLR